MSLLDRMAKSLREQLEKGFSPETSNSGKAGATPSAGHCAAASHIVREILGGEFASATVRGESHWFNRIGEGEERWDMDLTGDQFGLAPARVAPAGELYPGTRERAPEEMTEETRERARRLAERAGIRLERAAGPEPEPVRRGASPG